ncbi:hypothetical protein [Streptomyces sp. NRRL S-455]|uniref:hypothetical protein n=1 Tax=Streptomyces sp. NRRL S-455 TaxID=1463908 RepID=UPI00068C9D6F|nr:hypothetical protein [Streptomyces sp. NRRL S-455]
MSPAKQLPAPGRAPGLSDVLRARHASATATTPDPFAPKVLDPATVTGTAEERLAAFEAAIDEAKEAASHSLKAARARFVVEAGTALRAIRDEDGGLYKVTHETFEQYISDRWDMDRSRAYQLIDAAPTMNLLSKIFDTAPVESQARALAPVLEAHGEEAVREVVVAVKQAGAKVTAATIKEAAHRLHYIPAQTAEEDEGSADLPTEHTPQEALAIVRLEQGLAALRVAHKALRGTVVTDALEADHERGLELAKQVASLAAKIGRLTP